MACPCAHCLISSAFAKARPGQVNYGSAGAGTTPFFTMELLKAQQKISLTHVAYRGQPEVMTDLIRGDIGVTAMTVPLVVQQVQAGRIKALAVTSSTRLPSLPDVPTVTEQGMPEPGDLQLVRADGAGQAARRGGRHARGARCRRRSRLPTCGPASASWGWSSNPHRPPRHRRSCRRISHAGSRCPDRSAPTPPTTRKQRSEYRSPATFHACNARRHGCGRMAAALRPRRLLPADRSLRHVGPGLDPHLGDRCRAPSTTFSSIRWASSSTR